VQIPDSGLHARKTLTPLAWHPRSSCISVNVVRGMLCLHVVGEHEGSRLARQGSQATIFNQLPSSVLRCVWLALGRQDFKGGKRKWQEHPDSTIPRPTSWGPKPYWIYQVLQPELLITSAVRVECGRLSHGVSVVLFMRSLRALSFMQDTTVNMSSFGPVLEAAFARAGIPRRSGTPRQ